MQHMDYRTIRWMKTKRKIGHTGWNMKKYMKQKQVRLFTSGRCILHGHFDSGQAFANIGGAKHQSR
jgi:hypothetical protein